jgi:hypothetical protein
MIDLDAAAKLLDLTLSPERHEEVAKNLVLLAAMAALVEAVAPADGSEAFGL